MKKGTKFISTVITVLFLTCTITACNQKREFGEGVYHMESDPDVTITITDVVDTPGNEDHDKICKVQFSENFDFSEFEEDAINYLVINEVYFTDSQSQDLDEKELEKKFEKYRKAAEEKINYTKQFAENPCSFVMMHNEGETYSSLLAYVYGVNDSKGKTLYQFEIVIDENGRLIPEGKVENTFK